MTFVCREFETYATLKSKTEMTSPVLRQIGKAALTSGSLYTLGDVVNQKLLIKKERLDWRQTLRFALVGATLHGPYFLGGFKVLDRVFGTGRSLSTVLLKSISGQMMVFPPFVLLMLGYTSILENRGSTAHVTSKIRDSFLPIFLNGFYCWPLANVITFKFVPDNLRIVWINCVGLVWNSYLSWELTARSRNKRP